MQIFNFGIDKFLCIKNVGFPSGHTDICTLRGKGQGQKITDKFLTCFIQKMDKISADGLYDLAKIAVIIILRKILYGPSLSFLSAFISTALGADMLA